MGKKFLIFFYIQVVLAVIISYIKSYNLNHCFLEGMGPRSCTVQIHLYLGRGLYDVHCGNHLYASRWLSRQLVVETPLIPCK